MAVRQAILANFLRKIIARDSKTCVNALDDFATAVANAASAIGSREFDPSTRTPFSENAKCEGLIMEGGKLDDVCVVCAVVRSGHLARREDGDAIRNNF